LHRFENRVAESLTDYRTHYSDWRQSDFKHHRQDFNERYQSSGFRSGYETTVEMPKAEVAKAFSVPALVALLCGAFLSQYHRGPKKNECAGKDELERNELTGRADVIIEAANKPCEDRFQCE